MAGTGTLTRLTWVDEASGCFVPASTLRLATTPYCADPFILLIMNRTNYLAKS